MLEKNPAAIKILNYLESIHGLYLPRHLLRVASDHRRIELYSKAIKRAIEHTENAKVILSGIGSVVLAMSAARAGAQDITIFEPRKYLASIYDMMIADNNLSEKIIIRRKRLTDVIHKENDAQRPNILVLDCIDCSLFGQGITVAADHACKNILSEDAKIIPSGASIYALPLEQRTNQISGFDLTPFNKYRWNTGYEEIYLGEELYKSITEPFKVMDLDFTKPIERKNLTYRIPIVHSGVLNAITCWFDLCLDQETTLSTSPPSERRASWYQALQYLDREMEVKSGEELSLQANLDRNNIYFKLNETASTQRKVKIAPSVQPWHFPMIADEKRNGAYEKAIKKAVQKAKNSRVLDIGTGTGLLAMMAKRAGASTVTACEMIPHIAHMAEIVLDRNGFKNRIQLLPKPSYQIVGPNEMPAKANILVSETVDHSLLGEGFISTLMHARQYLLSKDPIIIPASATVFAMGIELRVTKLADFNIEQLNLLNLNHYTSLDLKRVEYTQITEIFEAFKFNFYDREFNPNQKIFEVPVIQSGTCNAVAFWYDLYLDEDTIISTGPDSPITAWQQAINFFDEEIIAEKDSILPIHGYHNQNVLSFGIDRLDCMLRGINIHRLKRPQWYNEYLKEESEIHSLTREITRLLRENNTNAINEILEWLYSNAVTFGLDPIIVSDFILQLGYAM